MNNIVLIMQSVGSTVHLFLLITSQLFYNHVINAKHHQLHYLLLC